MIEEWSPSCIKENNYNPESSSKTLVGGKKKDVFSQTKVRKPLWQIFTKENLNVILQAEGKWSQGCLRCKKKWKADQVEICEKYMFELSDLLHQGLEKFSLQGQPGNILSCAWSLLWAFCCCRQYVKNWVWLVLIKLPLEKQAEGLMWPPGHSLQTPHCSELPGLFLSSSGYLHA